MAVIRIFVLFVCLAFGGIVVETTGTRLKRAGGGIPITIDVAPYFVSLRRNEKHVCGGAFVSRQHVLTAAHCVFDQSGLPLYNTSVVSGVDVFNEADHGHEIKNISAHEDFRPGESSCDIAVITLWTLFALDDNKRQQIALPSARITYEMVLNYTAFGYKNIYNKRVLQQIGVHIPRRPNPSLSGREFYGTLFGQSMVNKDLGGPLEYNNMIVGIAAKRSGGKRRACFFVNVIEFKAFIEKFIGIERSSTTERPSVISYAPKRPRY